MNFFKLPNSIFDLSLKPSEILVYSALCSMKSGHDSKVVVSARFLSSRCNISTKTVVHALKNLENKGVLRSKNRYNFDGNYIAKEYTIKICCARNSFFRITPQVFSKNLSPSAFAVYLFLCKCADKTGSSFPSLSAISRAVGITVKTVINALNSLTECLVLKKSNYIKKDGGFGHNRFTLIADIYAKVNSVNTAYKEQTLFFQKAIILVSAFKSNAINLAQQFSFLKKAPFEMQMIC